MIFETLVRIIMIDYENKRIILGNNTNVMSTEPLKAVKCRNGEIVEAQIEESDGYGLILFDAQTQSRLYCPFYNITEEQESVNLEVKTLQVAGQAPIQRAIKVAIVCKCLINISIAEPVSTVHWV